MSLLYTYTHSSVFKKEEVCTAHKNNKTVINYSSIYQITKKMFHFKKFDFNSSMYHTLKDL